jgi:ATP-dependent Clp protease ATP-binding subunit ClpA
MFERFTDRARRVVVLAQEEARMLNHNYIGTEHILLGLIHEGEGVAAKGLEALGISLEAVRSQVEEIIGQGQQAPSGHIPFTPRVTITLAQNIFFLDLSVKVKVSLHKSSLNWEPTSIVSVSKLFNCSLVTKVKKLRFLAVHKKVLQQLRWSLINLAAI